MNEVLSAPLQKSESCTTALITDADGLAEVVAGKADEISTIPDSASNDAMSQPIPLSDIRNQVDDDSVASNQVGSSFPVVVSGIAFRSY
jgi:hypothetical protein